MTEFSINTPKGKREIGPGQPVFIIAEMSCNHHQSYETAVKIIDAAAQAGVDAVKLQTYTPNTTTIDSDKEYFQIKVNEAWQGQTLHQLYQQAYTPWDWHGKLKDYAESKGLVLFSFPLDVTAVDFLETLKVDLYKVGSFEVVDIPLLKRIGQTKKPVIISRGMASLEELELAIKTLKDNGCPQVAILHCISAYPAKPADMNLLMIPDIAKRFKTVVGLSDHCLGKSAAVAAFALGASIVEKHFILSRAEGGPDAAYSLEPAEFKDLVLSIRDAEVALGQVQYGAGLKEAENIIFRKSLFVVEDVKKGEKFTPKNVRSIRPGHGLEPKYYDQVIGQTAAADISRATPLSWSLIAK